MQIVQKSENHGNDFDFTQVGTNPSKSQLLRRQSFCLTTFLSGSRPWQFTSISCDCQFAEIRDAVPESIVS